MANTKQAQKMIRKTKRRTAYNKWWKNKVKEAIKTLDEIVARPESKSEEVTESYRDLQKIVDKAEKNGVIKKNRAIRIKSRKAKSIDKTKKAK